MAGEVKQAPRERSFSYAPARGKGLLFLFPVCAGLIALEIFLFLRFDITQVGLQFFLLLIALLLIAVPLVFLLYRLYSLLFSAYRLERDGLHIQWGLRTEVIPLNAIEWIRSPMEMMEDVPWSVLPMPGAYLGTVQANEHLTYEFLASDMNKMLFVGTPRSTYAISPQNPAAFLNGFERILQMGTLTNVEWTTSRPGNWLIEAWQSKAGRISVLSSLVFLITLYIYVGIRFQVGGTISLSFSPSGEPLESISSVNMLVVPLGASFIWLTGSIMGLLLFQRQENRRTAEIVWGAVSAAVLQCLIAALMIF